MFNENIRAEFFRISRATSNIEDLSRNFKQLLGPMINKMGKLEVSNFP